MKAQNKQEFNQVWTEEVNTLGLLFYSLKDEKQREKLSKAIKQLKKIVEFAANETFPQEA